MNKRAFNNLVSSICEAGRIGARGIKPSRVREFAPVDVKGIRERLGKSQTEVATLTPILRANLAELGARPAATGGPRPGAPSSRGQKSQSRG